MPCSRLFPLYSRTRFPGFFCSEDLRLGNDVYLPFPNISPIAMSPGVDILIFEPLVDCGLIHALPPRTVLQFFCMSRLVMIIEQRYSQACHEGRLLDHKTHGTDLAMEDLVVRESAQLVKFDDNIYMKVSLRQTDP